ncbi:conserved hypothetical protein [Pediculus humanus corporis]|uniref:Uncharacterized protein n=1 Tax=Pediculus humanus subsp. corporis TaxID=121224 RepID=E0VJI2_PEDHC|nr:uncharacterized protein Phum_PHUM245530 [Pediculus humanus corporis]EEB13538.1 conserved hypothetical protein [Pediculus humanus corporis]
MEKFFFYVSFSLVFIITKSGGLSLTSSSNNEYNEKEEPGSLILSRKRRYVVFPEGSTLSVAACVSPTALTGAGAIFTSGIAWALSYDLPNETIHTKHHHHHQQHYIKHEYMIHRQKRDLFVRMEKLIDRSGFDGKSCVLKTICETAQKITSREGILEEILRIIFTYTTKTFSTNNEITSDFYGLAQKAGENNENCNKLFPCPVSLLQLGLNVGKY